MFKIDYAIISAMPEELEFINNKFTDTEYQEVEVNDFTFKVHHYKNTKILISYSGIGTAFAAGILALIHSYFKPEYVLVSGTAGGLKKDLKIGDVIIAETAFEAEVQDLPVMVIATPFETCLTHPVKNKKFPLHYSADTELLEICDSIDNMNFKKGTIVSSNAFPAPKELFKKIESFNPWCIDMETSAFYQMAWLFDIKILAIRGISNILNSDGTDDNIDKSDVPGSSKAAANLLLAILDKSIELKSHANRNLMHDEVNALIKKYDLQPHPEGGYFARVYSSVDTVKPLDTERYNDEIRIAGSAIYYLLNGEDISAWHTMKSDELWHYYRGSPMYIHVIDKKGELRTWLLGDPLQTPGATFQVCVRAGSYFSAENVDKNAYSLIGCSVSPGFEFKDWKLADKGFMSELFPKHQAIIERLSH